MTRPDTRQRLLDAGLAVIHRHGFAATGVQAIAEAAGVPKGSFYNYFNSKEAFGVAVIDAYEARLAHAFALLGDTAQPPRRRLHGHFAALRDELAANRFAFGCFVANMAAEAASISEPLRLRLQHLLSQWSAALVEALAAAQAVGELRGGLAPDILADVLLDGWSGAIQRSKVDRSGRPLDSFAALLGQVVPP